MEPYKRHPSPEEEQPTRAEKADQKEREVQEEEGPPSPLQLPQNEASGERCSRRGTANQRQRMLIKISRKLKRRTLSLHLPQNEPSRAPEEETQEEKQSF